MSMSLKNQMRRKNNSEVLTSNILNQNKGLGMGLESGMEHSKIHEEQSKDNIFLESFSDITKNMRNHIGEPLIINLEEMSVLDGPNNMNLLIKNLSNTKSANKALIKTITSKFHELFLKLANQIKILKNENCSLKKSLDTLKTVENSGTANQQNPNNISQPAEIIETDNDVFKFLLNEEQECFNQILFDFNVQFNDLQSQEETLRREILKKHKEMEKVHLDIDECKKQKDSLVKELQNIAVKLNEYKNTTPQHLDNPSCNTSRSQIEEESENGDDMDYEEFNLLINADNREYLIKKILQENKKYKSIVKVMKTEEAEFNNYLIQLESELENFAKFKNFCLTKVNTVEENVVKCRSNLDVLCDKVGNIELQLEITEENSHND